MTIKDEVIRWGTWIAETRDRGIINEPTLTIGEQMDIDTILSDAVRVVRCGNCKFLKPTPNTPYKDVIGLCAQYDNLPILLKTAEDYCSEGEPQETTNPNFKDGV